MSRIVAIGRIVAWMLAFTFLASIFLMGADSPATRKKHAAKSSGPTLEEEVRHLKEQLSQQQSQIKEQQDQIQTLQQQVQQGNSALQQQNQQLQTSVQAAEQKASAAQDATSSLNSSVIELKASAETVNRKLEADQKTIDKLVNPDKFFPAPTVVEAVAPVRVLPIDPPVKNGLVPALRLGMVHVAPYGFLKATAVEDSSDPHGDDFPLPGYIAGLTNSFGPNWDPEFHLKARSSRFGANFEFPDISKKLTLTGRVEADFEGNFSRADNRNVSTYRSSMLGLRLAYARLDYAANDKTDVFFEGGQDWTLFGSSALGNLLETTFFGAYFGQTYERAPQMRLGLVRKLGGSRNFKISPEIAIMMPLEGLVPAACPVSTIAGLTTSSVTVPTACGSLNVDNGAALGNQLGYGERQGQDSNRPELETRAVLQWQLDKAPGVASAQLIGAAFESKREAVVLPAEVPAAFKTAFPDGATQSSKGYGVQIATQLPTRWATLTFSAYRGADLRFMFGGQLTSIYNNTFGLSSVATALSIDGATTQAFGFNSAGLPVIAPQVAVRGYGGFLNLGLPLSRLFNANPKGHNAGWQLLFHYGLDGVNADDFRHLHSIWAPGTTLPGADAAVAAGPLKSTMGAATVYYKFNRWCQFAYEESLYTSYAIQNINGTYVGAATGFLAGQREWRDRREEFGPIFTF
jgi:hypothetical protein